MSRVVSFGTAAMMLIVMCVSCSHSKPPPPPKSLTYSGQACKIYRAYAKAKFTNVGGQFNDSVELPRMLSRALPYFPKDLQPPTRQLIKYETAIGDNMTDPKARAKIRKEMKFDALMVSFGVAGFYTWLHDTCMKTTDLGY